MRGHERVGVLLALALALVVAAPQARADRPAPQARVRFGAGNAGPGIDGGIIRRYMRRNLRRLRACYNARPATAPVGGRVQATFTIGPRGSVILAAATGFSAAVATCVETAIRRIKFPRPRAGKPVPVYYPMHFVPPNRRRSAGHGTGWGTIGVSRGRPAMRRRPPSGKRLEFVWASFRVVGDLDKAIIRRYLRRKRPRLRYCLERQLLVNPKLTGRLNARFTILPTGKVVGAAAAGINGAVSSCVAGTLASIRFPKPKGGGIVRVRFFMRVRDRNRSAMSRFPRGMQGTIVKAAPTIGGGAIDVHGVVLKHARRLHACYKRALRKNPGLRGSVTVRFGLAGLSGRPVKLVAWGLRPVAGCIAYVMRKLRYSGGGSPALPVVYRFTFAPK